MWRVAIAILVLSAGCAGEHEKRAPDDPWVFGPGARDPQPRKHRESDDVGSDICAGLFDVLFGGGN